jgi:hypothetical protein
MRPAIRAKVLTASLTTKLTPAERVTVETASRELGLSSSEFIRRLVLKRLSLSTGHRLILAEICATRKEVEDLLLAISNLDGNDIERARAGADHLRHASVERRLLEQKQHEELENA